MMPRTGYTLALACASTLLACGSDSPPSAEFESEGWIDTAPPGPPSARPTAADDEGAEGDDEGDEVAGYWGIFGAYEDGMLSDVEGEFFVAGPQDEEELCLVLFPIAAVSPASGCDQCANAWDFEVGQPVEEINIDGACQTYGPSQIAGLVLKRGLTSDQVLLGNDGQGWRPIGEAWLEDGGVSLEWPDSDEESDGP